MIDKNRIDFLDGLRGIAILVVVLYHAYVRWPTFVPYGTKFASIAIFKYGYLGVNLFFLISGFVILISLENSRLFLIFIYKRWIRLFPAMAVCTVLIYTTLDIFNERPAGVTNITSVIPGLLFIEPNWIKIIFSAEFVLLEGAFWSLFVEMKFYFIFGFLYFLFGKEKSIIGLILLYLFSLITISFHIPYLEFIATELSLQYFGWFACGCISYLYYCNNQIKYLFFSALIIGIEAYLQRLDVYHSVSIVAIGLLFFIPICFVKFRFVFNNSPLLMFGFISYPLYLLHENAMIALIVKLSKFNAAIPHFLLPILPILFISIIAYLVAKFIEPLLRNQINKLVDILKCKILELTK